MHAAVTRLKVRPEKVAEAVRAMEEALPALRQEPGQRGALLLTEDSGDVLLIGLWETAADAAAWMTGSASGADLRERYRPLLAAPPSERTLYAVRVRDLH